MRTYERTVERVEAALLERQVFRYCYSCALVDEVLAAAVGEADVFKANVVVAALEVEALLEVEHRSVAARESEECY